MKIAIISDTHNQDDRIAHALELARERGVELLLHCGDICEPHLLDHLAGLPSAVVWGNCDWDRQSLQRYAQSIDVPFYGAFADLELDARRIAVLHGDDRTHLDALLKAQQHDYLLHGHTHIRRDERIGKTRIINPGALHRAAEKTVALLDTASDKLEYLRIA